MSKKIIAYITGLVAVLAIAGAIGIGVTMNATPEVTEAAWNKCDNSVIRTIGQPSVDRDTGQVSYTKPDNVREIVGYCVAEGKRSVWKGPNRGYVDIWDWNPSVKAAPMISRGHAVKVLVHGTNFDNITTKVRLRQRN